MRIAVLSDIHGNAPALRAVLADASEHACDKVWFLGDMLGYGPLPVACINLLDAWTPEVWLMGNHDYGALFIWQGKSLDHEDVRTMAPSIEERRIFHWHATQLDIGLPRERIERLLDAPTWKYISPFIYAAHGAVLDDDPRSLINVGANAYCKADRKHVVSNMLNTIATFGNDGLPRLILVGHTHIPTWARVSRRQTPYEWEWQSRERVYAPYNDLEPGVRLITADGEGEVILACPGSVGHRPTEDDAQTAYLILTIDDESGEPKSIHFRRLSYAVGEFRAAKVMLPPRDVDFAIQDSWWRAVESILDAWSSQELTT